MTNIQQVKILNFFFSLKETETKYKTEVTPLKNRFFPNSTEKYFLTFLYKTILCANLISQSAKC